MTSAIVTGNQFSDRCRKGKEEEKEGEIQASARAGTCRKQCYSPKDWVSRASSSTSALRSAIGLSTDSAVT